MNGEKSGGNSDFESYVEVGLISGTSDLSTFVPFAFFISFFIFFQLLATFDFFASLAILCIPSV